MKCVICHSENIRVKPVYEEIRQDQDIIRVYVEIPVCADCGERYYDRPTMQRLEQVREKLRVRDVPLREVGKVLVCDD